MKNLKLYFVLLFSFFSCSVLANHGSGGEITWECLPNGQFKFKLIFYRDCNGINSPVSVNLTTTVPGLPLIIMPKTSQTDISPLGLQSDGITPCVDCFTPGGVYGSLQQSVYESAPVTLNGTPPVAGWQFYWGECCRSAFLGNILNPSSTGFRYRAIMYPFQGQNMNPCFDSSPYFVEKPVFATCAGLQLEYSYLCRDAELDSLVYSWGSLLTDVGAPVSYAPGYSITSPLPAVPQNPLNVAAILNSENGHVTYKGYTGGLFATNVKVTAYKCGIKVAEVFREVHQSINVNCPSVMGGTQNLPPEISAPFLNTTTGLYTEYADTVYVGDTVNFQLTFTDFQFFNNGLNQVITIEANGDMFGFNYLNPNTGCHTPPCATLNYQVPAVAVLAGVINFSWPITCDHVFAQSSGCSAIPRPYLFTFKVSDNYCPANAFITKTVSVLVLPHPRLEPPEIRCADVNVDGSVNLSWTPSASVALPGHFSSYRIYASTSFNGNYFLIDTVSSGINANSYVHSSNDIINLFGSNANDQKIYYKIQTASKCQPFYPPTGSAIVASMKLNVTENLQHHAVLNWNAPSSPLLSSHHSKYLIHKEYPLGTWTLIDSTSAVNYIDSSVVSLCNDSVTYKVTLSDSTGCILNASLAGTVINDPAAVASISPANFNLCQGANVTLTATAGLSYLWVTGATTQSINVSVAGTYSVTVTLASGCSAQASAVVTVNAPPTPVITGNTTLCQGQNTVLNAGQGYFNYNWSIGSTTQTINIQNSGTYTVTVTDACGVTGTASVTVTVNPLPVTIAVASGSTTFCEGDSVLLSVQPGFQNYIWYRHFSPVVPNVFSPSFYAKMKGSYYCVVTDVNGCSGSSNTINVNVPCVPIGPNHEKLNQENDELNVTVFPNPSNGDFIVKANYKITLTVFDLSGKQIDENLKTNYDNDYVISGIPNGIYILKVSAGTESKFIRLVKLE